MVESFLKYLQFEKRLSQNTVLAYQTDLEQFTFFLRQHYPDLTSISADYSVIRPWIIQLVGNGLDARSVNRKIACLRSYYKYLRRQEIIGVDPMMKIKILKTKKMLPGFVKEADMVHLLDHVNFDNSLEGSRNKLMLELFYSTGIRLSELIHLRQSQVDLGNRTIKVLGKRNKERVIPFPSPIVSILNNYLCIRNKEVTMKDHGLLFVTERGEPCYPMMIYRIVNKYLQENTNSTRTSPHILRHTYATHLLNKGAEINAVKDLLGHASLAATQVYTHNSLEKLKKVFEQAHPKA